jgi:hypothetical protein
VTAGGTRGTTGGAVDGAGTLGSGAAGTGTGLRAEVTLGNGVGTEGDGTRGGTVVVGFGGGDDASELVECFDLAVTSQRKRRGRRRMLQNLYEVSKGGYSRSVEDESAASVLESGAKLGGTVGVLVGIRASVVPR